MPTRSKREAVCDRRAGALEHGTRPELAAGERARQGVERLDLGVRLAGYDVVVGRWGGSRRTDRVYAPLCAREQRRRERQGYSMLRERDRAQHPGARAERRQHDVLGDLLAEAGASR